MDITSSIYKVSRENTMGGWKGFEASKPTPDVLHMDGCKGDEICFMIINADLGSAPRIHSVNSTLSLR